MKQTSFPDKLWRVYVGAHGVHTTVPGMWMGGKGAGFNHESASKVKDLHLETVIINQFPMLFISR